MAVRGLPLILIDGAALRGRRCPTMQPQPPDRPAHPAPDETSGRGRILTPDQRLRVFVSSTLDLTGERAAAKRAIESLHLIPVMFEIAARPHPPRSLYRAYLEQSDVFVAVYSTRYGWTAPGMEVSGLEDEFELSAGMPRLVYIQQGVEREPELDAFLSRVQDAGLSYKHFASPEELQTLLMDDLVILLTERFRDPTEDEPDPPVAPAPLPDPPTPFLGRSREVADLAAQLARDDVRLITLLGPGGIGKTRLAIETARSVAAEFPGGTYFVPLASLREPALVGEAIAAALDIATSDPYPTAAAIAELVRDRRALFVLDNFEQVLGAAGAVAELVSACPALKVIVTSRAPLRLRGEHEIQVCPLDVPDEALLPADAAEYAAVRLFVESARGVRPGFALDESTTADVVAICRELDGLPLAIELAAAMTRLLPPHAILERLRERPTDLSAGLRDVPERHRRLSDTIAWSYELLDPSTKEYFAQLSIFRGGFTLDSAERVCDVPGSDVFSAIASLVEQSLLRADVDVERGARFSMLTTIRRFAADALERSHYRDGVEERHAQTFTVLVEEAGRSGGRRVDALDSIETELDNIRRAFEWFLERGRPDPVAEAVWEAWWFWWMRGYLREGKLWADRCLGSAGIAPGPRARVLAARAVLAIWSREYEFAVAAFEEARRVAVEAGDRRSVAYADVGCGLVCSLTRSMEEGTETMRRGVATFDELGDEAGAAMGLAAVSWAQAVTREFGDSDALFHEALERARAADSCVDMGIAEAAIAQFRMSRGETEGVYELVEASLEHLAGARHIGSSILTLEVVAELGLAAGTVEPSVGLLAATAAIRAAMGTGVPPQAAARLEGLVASGRRMLGDRFDDVWQEGSALCFPDAVDRGRSLLGELRSAAGVGASAR
jgi:predicted ATPase